MSRLAISVTIKDMNIVQFHIIDVLDSFVNLVNFPAQGDSRSFRLTNNDEELQWALERFGDKEIDFLYSALTQGIVRIDTDWQGEPTLQQPFPWEAKATPIEGVMLWEQPKRIVAITRDLPPTTIARLEGNHGIVFLSRLFDIARVFGTYEEVKAFDT